MDQRGDEVHTSTTEASAGSKEGVVRWVLIIGLILAIGLLTIIWMTGAFTQPDEVRHENVSREIAAEPIAERSGIRAEEQRDPAVPAARVHDALSFTLRFSIAPHTSASSSACARAVRRPSAVMR